MNLKDQFEQLCLPFSEDHHLIHTLWFEIEKKYSEKGRHYHNLLHLENMFKELEAVKSRISDFTTVSFSVFYHDIVYNATSKSNEEKSALLAETRLAELTLNKDHIKAVSAQILATKLHQKSEDEDTNYLLDADLSILGKDLKSYLAYTQMIRKEYSIYPDLLYKPGRKKVLKHFLELNSIFKTEYFKEKYEVPSRENISIEIQLL
ncbi:HD domain-containing protein [Chryseobacterium sp.]|uniref:HD domain-containing protein n=1 Tax=Chryseobacterium sp. TaxID=1871047 RepID=UPI002FCBB347